MVGATFRGTASWHAWDSIIACSALQCMAMMAWRTFFSFFSLLWCLRSSSLPLESADSKLLFGCSCLHRIGAVLTTGVRSIDLSPDESPLLWLSSLLLRLCLCSPIAIR